jgi:hypothetical protein
MSGPIHLPSHHRINLSLAFIKCDHLLVPVDMATLKAINQDVLLEILAHSSPAATSSLALTARHFLKDARLALYQRVRILGHTKSRLFFRTMYGCS